MGRKNCEAFLDNEGLGFDMIGVENHDSSNPLHGYEDILNNFRSTPNNFKDAKARS
jgi:hypothetical protein